MKTESEHERLWRLALVDLKSQMTSSTFNTWFLGSRPLSDEGDVMVVGVKNAYAKDWLENRLMDTVNRVVWSLAARMLLIQYEVARDEGGGVDRRSVDRNGDDAAASFVGFEPFQANFVQMPRQFFEVVLPGENPVVVAFVAGVIAQTIGMIVNFHTGERREWWEASFGEIGRVCGIQSRVSVRKAVRVSRVNGYVVRSRGRVDWRYRLRRMGEPADLDGD